MRVNDMRVHTPFSPASRTTHSLCLGLSLVTSSTLRTQQVPTWSITSLNASYPEPFDNMRAARELSDGRLIVLDFGFYVVNLSQGLRAPLSRSGDGPGEYRAPLRLFAFAGDTTAFLDMARPRRVFLILPSGEFRGSLSVPADLNARDPEAADDRGRLYAQHRRTKGPPGIRDSTDIIRWDPLHLKADTVAALMERWFISSLPLQANGALPPFATFNQWAVSRDGRVAVVTANPYRVTLFSPNGSVAVGPVLPEEQVRVTDAHRRAWLEKALDPVMVITSVNGGPRTTQFRRPKKSDIEPAGWPRFLPPFLPGAVSFAPDGMLWVLRTTADPALAMVDVIGRSGKLVARLALPKNRRLLCHGNDAVYLVRTDDDGLQYIERYRMPVEYREVATH